MEMRTALMVARLGTVSAAADRLGVHRATVNRHVETLERAFGNRLFQRHARGYTLTETGKDMLEIANRADEMFSDLAGRSKGRQSQLSGALVVTTLAGVAPLLMPALKSFHLAHPEIELEFIAGAQLARLEYGEAHVAIRAGARPETPDYVVQLLMRVGFGLFASQDYIARNGLPENGNFEDHYFVGSLTAPSPVPFAEWMRTHVRPSALSLRSTEQQVVENAVFSGLGIGFVARHEARARGDLVEVLTPDARHSAPLWIVTHVDLHRTEKVQAFVKRLKLLRAE